jgi:hypothetical protein
VSDLHENASARVAASRGVRPRPLDGRTDATTVHSTQCLAGPNGAAQAAGPILNRIRPWVLALVRSRTRCTFDRNEVFKDQNPPMIISAGRLRPLQPGDAGSTRLAALRFWKYSATRTRPGGSQPRKQATGPRRRIPIVAYDRTSISFMLKHLQGRLKAPKLARFTVTPSSNPLIVLKTSHLCLAVRSLPSVSPHRHDIVKAVAVGGIPPIWLWFEIA